ncbi:hypothetical protein GCM10023201_47940 [Actinomycetospora corticicola]|uniref:Uncharacterized protein n=1 Tax=Actinomycetospora corticicola TaxID=663602 RepID=A0A7Y9J6Z5_9PSEU|nr:hypothetical protein [Actinomycetospora corticicola]NYD37942.1 hypothetical protein [Actinomycetospora corticicola]
MRAWNRPLVVFTGAIILLVPVCLGGLLLDPRTLGGAPIWAKPLKFSISFALYAPTLAWMVSLARADRARHVASVAATVVAVASTIEMVAIVGQVLRGRASHFDVATPFDTAVWAVMGTSIAVLWVANLVIAVVLLRERSLTPSVAWGVRLGLLVSLLGMAVAFLMTSPSGFQIAAAKAGEGMPTAGAHAVGVPDGGPGLALLGWSTTGGDLRIGHFVGLHGLQVVPLVALGLLLLAPRLRVLRSETVRVRLVVITAATWTGLTLLLTWQALRAQPLLAPDALTLAALGGLVVVTALAVGAVLARAPRPTDREAVAA